MELNKNGDYVGTPIEHLEQLLDTHDCLCNRARHLIKILIKEAHDNEGGEE